MLIAMDRLVEWGERDEDACLEAARMNEEDQRLWFERPLTKREQLTGRKEGEPKQRGPVMRTMRGRWIALAMVPDRSGAFLAAIVVAAADGRVIQLEPRQLRVLEPPPIPDMPIPGGA